MHCRDIIWGKYEQLNTDVMYGVDESAFLQAITLYSSFIQKDRYPDTAPAVSCKRKDILDLPFEQYKANKQAVLDGFKLARKFLFSQYVFGQIRRVSVISVPEIFFFGHIRFEIHPVQI